jgi:predicted NUDIX family NTP pyrophosphohydrolase
MAARSKLSAGILLYRRRGETTELFLVHPGGPFWAKKDDGAWSIPKGEYEAAEDPLEAAKREFLEETGSAIDGAFLPLTPLKQHSGKVISAWCVEGDMDPGALRSNLFEMEWPPRSGKTAQFPEVDRGSWFSPDEARRKLTPGQVPFIDECLALTR